MASPSTQRVVDRAAGPQRQPAGGGRSTMAEESVRPPQRDRLLTPGEVASLFRVDPKTVTRWASAGRINSIRTPGGHRRFRESEVRALLRGETPNQPKP